jgi:predicted amidohydrolase YtcJ
MSGGGVGTKAGRFDVTEFAVDRRARGVKTSNGAMALLLVLCLMSSARGLLHAQEPEAEIILHNGKILTVDANFSVAETVATPANWIVAVGQDVNVLKLAGPTMLVIDLKGRTVVPGLIDAHSHIHNYAEGSYGVNWTDVQRGDDSLDFRGVRSKNDVLEQIRGVIHKYHNSKAIDILRANYGDIVKRCGRYWINAAGAPDGHLEGPPATRLGVKYLPKYSLSPGSLASIYQKYLQELAATGITGLSTWLPTQSIKAYQLLDAKGELTHRLAYGMEDFFGTTLDLANGMKAAA